MNGSRACVRVSDGHSPRSSPFVLPSGRIVGVIPLAQGYRQDTIPARALLQDDIGRDMPETTSHKLLSLIQAWLPVLTVVVGSLWALYTYLAHQQEVQSAAAVQAQKEAATRLIEARKPFLEKQLALYFETAQITGKLATITPDTGEWEGVERRFWELYWSELSMVEDSVVEAAMVEFGKALADFTSTYRTAPDKEEKKRPLHSAAYELAHALRRSMESGWSGGSLSVRDSGSYTMTSRFRANGLCCEDLSS